jgi:hypothetical protein
LPLAVRGAIWLLHDEHEEVTVSESFEDFKDRVQGERSVRDQRDAAERGIPGERLRRRIREAFEERSAARKGPAESASDEGPRPAQGPDGR